MARMPPSRACSPTVTTGLWASKAPVSLLMGLPHLPVGLVLAVRAMVSEQRHVERGVAVEEADRPQVEADVAAGHHWPILGAGHMVGHEAVPDHQVGVLQRPVRLLVAGKPIATGMLVHIVPGREQLQWVVSGDPQVASAELGPPDGMHARLVERRRARSRL